MAIPVEDWLALVEAFGPSGVAIYDEEGNSVDTATQVGDILEDQVIAPILSAASGDCAHPDPWYDRLIWLWFFAGWAPPTFAISQGWWAWGGPVMALWVVTGLVIVATFIGGMWDSCRRCGTNRAAPPRPWRR